MVVVADCTFVSPQYCNGGDLADYLQGECCCKHTLIATLYHDKATGLAGMPCGRVQVLERANMIACVL